MNVPDLEKMWSAFADIPTNSDDEIEVDFHRWEKGTYRFVPIKIGMALVDEKLPNGTAIDLNLI